MKLKWSELKVVVMGAFALCKQDKSRTATTVEDMLYQRYRETLPKRVPVGKAEEEFRKLNSTWDQQARAFAGPLKSILPKLNATQAAKVRSDYRAREKAKAKESGYDTDMYDDSEPYPDMPLEWILRGSPKPSHHFPTTLQFEKDGKTAQENTAPVNTKIEAIVCDVDKATMRSRLNLVVHPQCTGQPLLRK